ncbi:MULTISPECIES: hypothetical protein [unclassified Bradyrhizobium]|uniref:hypothetical protein n=1 Tax=unclassified Bradyrhizobium TaxID=2631580 RepID=UPI00247A700C|nr:MULTISPECIES: hypothetical protein [unclassified Bradyrhizobium]WGR73532.1 hypothetical protein MTX24_12245 [Bradyrhizobium sp. ISRA426]WGR78369.1 hypothetical protein MTX21_37215 [Bradyrhizobium sp. ISRA430]WGR88771.1 hypothetical protein MTX25_12260 [Bradyrhizobium sp. ISRA432]
MTTSVTALLLAGSLAMSFSGHPDPERNMILRNAAVDHDLAKVKRRIERTLNSVAAGEPDTGPRPRIAH